MNLLAIEKMAVKNFKSLKQFDINCRKINVFIGEPNTGKSNILEALGMLSYINARRNATPISFVRYESLIDLFYDRNIAEKIQIQADQCCFTLSFEDGRFFGDLSYPDVRLPPKENLTSRIVNLDYQGNSLGHWEIPDAVRGIIDKIKYYQFEKMSTFEDQTTASLLPPNGINLLSILLAMKDLRSLISSSV